MNASILCENDETQVREEQHAESGGSHPVFSQHQHRYPLLHSISIFQFLPNKNFDIQVNRPIHHLLVSSLSTMNVSQTIETEEDLLPCLHVKLYHPQQSSNSLYGLIPLGKRSKHPAEDPLRLGRDGQACTVALLDTRVSRKQLAIQAYYTPRSRDMLFRIQNLSQRAQLSVNSSALDYLEVVDLPDKALIRFGQYEMLIIRESGEAKASFEVEFEVLTVAPSRETCTCEPSVTPVSDTVINCEQFARRTQKNWPQ